MSMKCCDCVEFGAKDPSVQHGRGDSLAALRLMTDALLAKRRLG